MKTTSAAAAAASSSSRPGWREVLSSEERDEIKRLDREIKAQEAKGDDSVAGQRKLIFLKYQRKVIQNRVSVRARRMAETV